MMRLAIVASHPVQYQAPLFRELSRRFDLHVYYAHRASAFDQAAAGFGVEFEWDTDLLSGYAHTFLPNVARNPGLEHFGGCDTPSIGAEFNRLRPDALMVIGWHLKAYLQAAFAAGRAGIPVMVRGDSQLGTPRSQAKQLVKAIVYPAALRLFSAALYVGERSRRYWEHYHFSRRHMYFSPHCVDNEWFAMRADAQVRAETREAHGISPPAKVVLFAGKLVPFKRPFDVLSAVSRLRAAGHPVKLMIAGSGPLEQQLIALAREKETDIIPLGFCNQTKMPGVYAAADVLVLPSDGGETWGLVANEALACGTPIVVSDACGCSPDLAADGSAGLTFKCGDVDNLARVIRQMLLQPPSTHAIASKIGRYSISAAADGIAMAAETEAQRAARLRA